jgi:NADH-quinone oxidoreductase subunit G
MPKLTIDNKEIEIAEGSTLLQACEEAGCEVPRFCYHERLSIAGNCRMCLVELEKSPKLVASCALPAGDGMVVSTNSAKVHEARKGVMEFLLANHPLDCPICDQGGECDLQDQAMAYGFDRGRFEEDKRAVEDQNMGPLIETEMTRCIHCTRCVRFSTEVAGTSELGAFGRGENMEIMPYLEKTVQSELSGNMIDLCPVGALTSKPYAFTARVWELRRTPSIDVMDAVGSAIKVDSRGSEVMRILPLLNEAVNEEWISDKARFVYDGLARQRLDRPYIRKHGSLVEVSWEEILRELANKIRETKPEKIGAITGELACVESISVLKDLMAELGSPNMDCRVNANWQAPKERGGRLFNSKIAGIADADAILLIGTNPRVEAAIINARIFMNWHSQDIPIGLIGLESQQPYDYEYLGKDPSILDSLGSFEQKLQEAKNPMIILGRGALDHKSANAIYSQALALAQKVGAITEDWNGFNVLHANAGRVGALDIGFLPQSGGKNVDQMLKGECELLFLLDADDLDLSRLGSCSVVYQGSHGDKGAEAADFILPGSAWTEKNSFWVNVEGRVQEARRAIFPPGEARPDWSILRAVAASLNFKLPYDDLDSLRQHIVSQYAHFANVGEVAENNPMPTPSTPSPITKEPFNETVKDFYLSNPIARASKIMAECSRANSIALKPISSPSSSSPIAEKAKEVQANGS